MTVSIEEITDAVTEALESTLKNASSLSNRVYFGRHKQFTSYPSVIYDFSLDKPRNRAVNTKPLLFYDVKLEFLGGNNSPSEDMDSLLEYVGELVDALEHDQINAGAWRWLSIEDIDYAFNRSKSLTTYDALLKLKIDPVNINEVSPPDEGEWEDVTKYIKSIAF